MSPEPRPAFSVVVPVRNEEKNIPVLSQRLRETFEQMHASFEVIFVTDDNTDRTVDVLREQHTDDPRVKAIKLSRGMGQHIACVAGLDASTGDKVVLMDGDLQDYPEDIPKLVARMDEGFDVVFGTKVQKNESSLRNLYSRSFIKLINKLSDHPIQHNTSMFRVMSRRTVDELGRFREVEQSLTGLVGLIGFPHSAVEVTSGVRVEGETNYSFMRQINLAVSFMLSFSTKPLRMISYAGLTVSALSFLYLVVVLLQALLGAPVLGWPTIVVLQTALGGMQLLALGVIAEYVARIFMESKRRPIYHVEELMGLEPPGR